MLILPGDPQFQQTLSMNLPPNWREEVDRAHFQKGWGFAPDTQNGGVLRLLNEAAIIDYCEGGEYEILQAMEGDDSIEGTFSDDELQELSPSAAIDETEEETWPGSLLVF